jgi:hypothetical protein
MYKTIEQILDAMEEDPSLGYRLQIDKKVETLLLKKKLFKKHHESYSTSLSIKTIILLYSEELEEYFLPHSYKASAFERRQYLEFDWRHNKKYLKFVEKHITPEEICENQK